MCAPWMCVRDCPVRDMEVDSMSTKETHEQEPVPAVDRVGAEYQNVQNSASAADMSTIDTARADLQELLSLWRQTAQ